jgi:Zn-dependent peptidase ImmA (M78 family)
LVACAGVKARRDDLSSTATNAQEIEVNTFAAALLMPEDGVTKLRSSIAANPSRVVEVLAAEFDVSADAMGYRLINPGLSS